MGFRPAPNRILEECSRGHFSLPSAGYVIMQPVPWQDFLGQPWEAFFFLGPFDLPATTDLSNNHSLCSSFSCSPRYIFRYFSLHRKFIMGGSNREGDFFQSCYLQPRQITPPRI